VLVRTKLRVVGGEQLGDVDGDRATLLPCHGRVEAVETTSDVRRRVIVRGFVQGVGFRVSLSRTAQSRGVAGWVRNRADGTVEAVFEGSPNAVEAVVGWCKAGPRGAVVEDVEVTSEPGEGLRGFEIR
jgi:acylphosphatase